jgi:sugar phosphate isomerase/epimerase
MNSSICSYSFHRLFGAGKQDIFQYIATCKELGCTHLQPWNAHFARNVTLDDIVHLGHNPGEKGTPTWLDPPNDTVYLDDIRAAGENAGMPFELIAVDRATIYDENPVLRSEYRQRAYAWMDVAEAIGAAGIRIDAGGPREIDLPEDVYAIIVDGYSDLVARGRDKGVGIFIENHWGSSQLPENIIRYVEDVDGLKLLFDTNNWAPGRQLDGWRLCAQFADATHVKIGEFDQQGHAVGVDIPQVIRMLVAEGYDGIWGIESVPVDGDEIGGARKTLALIERCLNEIAH